MDTISDEVVNETPKQVGIFVVGMHRSGTSALTRVLSFLGCALPKTLMIPGPGNAEGHWECETISWFDDRLLAALNSKWDDWLAVDESWHGSVYYRRDVNLAAALLAAEFADRSPFVLKDPRICRLLPFWIDAADLAEVKPLFVLPIRNPVEVARSLYARDGIDEHYSHLVWLRHVLAAERDTRHAQRCFVDFDELYNDWRKMAARLESVLGLPWPRDAEQAAVDVGEFLKAEHRHHRHPPADMLADQSLSPWLRNTYEILHRWAREGEDANDYGALDELTRSLEAAAPAFRDLIASSQQGNGQVAQLEAKIAELDARGHELETDDQKSKELRAKVGDAIVLAEAKMQLEQTVATLEAEVARLGNDAVSSIEQIAAERDRAEQAGEERNQFGHKVLAAEGEVGAATAEIMALRHQLAELSSHLSQRQEEVSQAWREAEQNRITAELASALAEKRQIALADADGWVFRLAADRANLETRLNRALKQSNASAVRSANEIAVSRNVIAELESQLVFAENQAANTNPPKVEEPHPELTNLRQMVAKLEAELASVSGRTFAATEDAAELKLVRLQISDLREHIARQEQNSIEVDAKTRLIEQRLGERVAEVGTVMRMVQRNSHETALEMERAEWLREVNGLLMRSPRWWNVMPSSWRQQKTQDRLKRRGLFDADSYLAKYPDVVAAGIDPVYHYIAHGMREGRDGGIDFTTRRLAQFAPALPEVVAAKSDHVPVHHNQQYQQIPINYDERRIIILDGTYPTPDRDSGSVDAVNFIQIFKELDYAVYFIATANFNRNERDAVAENAFRELQHLGVHIVDDRYGPNVAEVIRLNGGYFEVFFLSRVYAGGIFFEDIRTHAPESRIIFNTVDVHWRRELREGELEGNRLKVIGAYRTAEREHYLARLADATIVVTGEELQMIVETVPGARVFEIPLVRDIPGTTVGLRQRHGIGFIGGYKHQPNIDAVNYFIDEIWPLIRVKLPNLEFHIMGADMPDALLQRQEPGIVIVGHVADLQQAFDSLRLSVAPLRVGAGSKGKVISSLSHGLPCVATAIAAEGMKPNSGIVVANTPTDFATEVIRLCLDDSAWQLLSNQGVESMRERHSRSVGMALFSNILAKIK